jgi:hypothetical protein
MQPKASKESGPLRSEPVENSDNSEHSQDFRLSVTWASSLATRLVFPEEQRQGQNFGRAIGVAHSGRVGLQCKSHSVVCTLPLG